MTAVLQHLQAVFSGAAATEIAPHIERRLTAGSHGFVVTYADGAVTDVSAINDTGEVWVYVRDQVAKLHYLVSFASQMLLAERKGRYTLYHIGMVLRKDIKDVPDSFRSQVWAGYYGVTGRPPWVRWDEHIAAAYSGKGFALHSALHAAYSNQWEGYLRLSICDTAATLPDIYALEEEAVRATLLPRGLNTIPGGYAGIRALQSLGLLKNKRVNPEQRDAVLVRMEADGRAGPRAHYRRGHVRQLADRKTWVRACFVALSGALPEGLYAQS